ncbi:MAG: SDR family NAD(P)-dependent oxidoreductase, partial [Gammaproteobacteria bacterium]|nr:SDR family NAD(P)-dependent oxidoreductase [Gammaproteobacteria bacterium]
MARRSRPITENSSVWVITGAASGIGASVTRSVAATGQRVLALDVADKDGQAVAQSCGASYEHCDVGSVSDWQKVVERLSELGAPTNIH